MKVPLEDLQIAVGHDGGHVWRSMEIVRPSQSTRSTHHVQKDMSCRKVWNCISSNALELLLYDMFLQFYHYVVGRTSTRKYPHLLMNPCFNRLIPSNPIKTPYFSWWNSMSTISAKFLGRWFPWFPMISHGSQAAGRDGAARVMTICNTGALATAGWGTALGVLRTLHARGAFGARRESCPFWKLCKKGGKWDMMGLEIFEHLHILELSIQFLALCFGLPKQQLLKSQKSKLFERNEDNFQTHSFGLSVTRLAHVLQGPKTGLAPLIVLGQKHQLLPYFSIWTCIVMMYLILL